MDAVFLKLLNMSITASWLVLLVIVLRFLLKKAPKSLTILMWALVAVRLVCPFSFESVLSLVPNTEPVPPEIVYTQEVTPGTSEILSHVGNNPVDYSLGIDTQTGSLVINEMTAPDSDTVNPLLLMTTVASIVWAAGVAAMLLYTLVSCLRVRKSVSEAAYQKDNIWLCDRISTPFILGVFRPKIYLPSDINEQDAEYVIAHEKAHLRRLDHVWKPLGFALLSVYWFNPLMWLSYVLFCRDIELACDERVIKSLGQESKKPYSNALINCSTPKRTVAACPLAFGETGVKTRIKSVLTYKKPAFWVVAVGALLVAVLAVCFLTNPKTAGNSLVSPELDAAVSEAILNENASKSWLGECPTEGHVILGTDETDTKAVVYAIEKFNSFGFYSGYFVDVGGHRVPAVFRFNKVDGKYILDRIDYAEDGSGHTSSIKRLFPKECQKRALSPTESDNASLWKQCAGQAEKYLKKIGRQAEVKNYSEVLLSEPLGKFGISDEVVNKTLELGLPYNSDVSFFESIENGIRYIYRTSYLSHSGNILYTKEQYGSNTLVEAITVSGKTGEILSRFSGCFFDAQVISVSTDGFLVKPFDQLPEMKLGEIFVPFSTVTESFPDVYESLYVRILYDGAFDGGTHPTTKNVYTVCEYGDVCYFGNTVSHTGGADEPLYTTRAVVGG